MRVTSASSNDSNDVCSTPYHRAHVLNAESHTSHGDRVQSNINHSSPPSPPPTHTGLLRLIELVIVRVTGQLLIRRPAVKSIGGFLLQLALRWRFVRVQKSGFRRIPRIVGATTFVCDFLGASCQKWRRRRRERGTGKREKGHARKKHESQELRTRR